MLDCIMVIDDDEPTNFISTMVIEEAGCTRHLEIADSGNGSGSVVSCR